MKNVVDKEVPGGKSRERLVISGFWNKVRPVHKESKVHGDRFCVYPERTEAECPASGERVHNAGIKFSGGFIQYYRATSLTLPAGCLKRKKFVKAWLRGVAAIE
jgi:hypothetical protein